VIVIYYLLPVRYRWLLLLLGSYAFFSAVNVEFALVLLSTTVVDYFAAIEMEHQLSKKRKLPFLIISLAVNLAILGLFRYFNFFTGTMSWIGEHLQIGIAWPVLDLLVPVGISFYILKSLSYMFDVYRGHQTAERHFGYYALYVSFFPQLVAGPIEKYQDLAPQFKLNHSFSYQEVVNGFRLILYGFFVKMVIGDNLAFYVDQVFEDYHAYGTVDILLSWVFFSFQIYADFYGYSLIAIGSALTMGIHIMDNFRTPYLSRSISEFCNHWHISLSAWFREYLYNPLAGTKKGTLVRFTVTIFVFMLAGLWHGAAWSFVLWGGIFAMLFILEQRIYRREKWVSIAPFTSGHLLSSIVVFAVVTLMWVLFRSQSLSEALMMIQAMFFNANEYYTLDVSLVMWVMLALFMLTDILMYGNRFDKYLDNLPSAARWVVYLLLIFSVIVFHDSQHSAFIYFQF
jgi:D-alanyl-lipoteichoic acid acyltransferase DltB (MBOAT superfamily)